MERKGRRKEKKGYIDKFGIKDIVITFTPSPSPVSIFSLSCHCTLILPLSSLPPSFVDLIPRSSPSTFSPHSLPVSLVPSASSSPVPVLFPVSGKERKGWIKRGSLTKSLSYGRHPPEQAGSAGLPLRPASPPHPRPQLSRMSPRPPSRCQRRCSPCPPS